MNTNPTDAAPYISAGLHRSPPGTGIIRSELIGPHLIRDVMAVDIKRIIGDRGADTDITEGELIALGWTKVQVHEHGQAAIAQLAAEAETGILAQLAVAPGALAAHIAALEQVAETAHRVTERLDATIAALRAQAESTGRQTP